MDFNLVEQKDGFIIGCQLFKDYPLSDTQIVKESVTRIKENYTMYSLATDRGFNSKKNDRFLKNEKVFNATCSRDPEELAVKMNDERFRDAQQRIAQTEGRVGIFKNKFYR